MAAKQAGNMQKPIQARAADENFLKKKKKKWREMHMAASQCGGCYQRVAPGFGNFRVVDAALNYNKTVAYELFKLLSSQQDAGVTLAFVSA